MSVEISERQKKALRGRAHSLKPVVLIGKEGLSDSVVAAVDSALTTHELIKVKLLQNCLDDKTAVANALSERLVAGLVQRIGKTIVLYRERPADD
ncbi:MAG: ribosome assembly RNA-binding protein YhbY [Myxococcota bacterium]|nr:ribosome assembly RNA-binding protein YhbY [Myxococcota bacterium]